MKSQSSQYDKIVFHLMAHKSITTIEAFKKFSILRLGAVIFNIREKKKWNIRTDRISKGQAKYVLVSMNPVKRTKKKKK